MAATGPNERRAGKKPADERTNQHRNPARKQRGAEKTARIPIKVVPAERLKKPAGSASSSVPGMKCALRRDQETLREPPYRVQASCPNIHEVLRQGAPTFMIMGDICAPAALHLRRRPRSPRSANANEPATSPDHRRDAPPLSYVVITSVDRDDLRDGGAQHFVRLHPPDPQRLAKTTIGVLVPDFRGRMDIAVDIFDRRRRCRESNLETVPRLYKQARRVPTTPIRWRCSKVPGPVIPRCPPSPGLMVGLSGPTMEILAVLRDLRARRRLCSPSGNTACSPRAATCRLLRYVHPDTFKMFRDRSRSRWASATPPGPHWCVRATGPTSRLMEPAWCDSTRGQARPRESSRDGVARPGNAAPRLFQPVSTSNSSTTARNAAKSGLAGYLRTISPAFVGEVGGGCRAHRQDLHTSPPASSATTGEGQRLGVGVGLDAVGWIVLHGHRDGLETLTVKAPVGGDPSWRFQEADVAGGGPEFLGPPCRAVAKS